MSHAQVGPCAAEDDCRFRIGLHDWSIEKSSRGQARNPSQQTLFDEGGLCIRSAAGQPGRYVIAFEGLAEFVLNLARERIEVAAFDDTDDSTLRHLLADQVFPRIWAHQGSSVLHASAALVGHGALVFVGLSGSGKSTLAAYFHGCGDEVIGDDAIKVESSENSASAQAIYRSLRLFPDSAQLLEDTHQESSPVASYTNKRNLLFPADDRLASPVPIIAAVVLHGEPGDVVELTALSASDASMALAEHSFWLDPLDVAQARKRLADAGRLASQVPVYRLAYPRDYRVLPRVREQVLDAVGVRAS